MASLALREREAVESDEHARSTCGVRELRDAPVRRSVRQRAAAARRPTSIVCWWQSGDAGGAANRRRAPACATSSRDRARRRGGVRPTRHSPRRRRHRAAAWRPTRHSPPLAATRRHPRRATRSSGDQHDSTRRHTATSMSSLMMAADCASSARAPEIRGARQSGTERSAVKGAAFTFMAPIPRARARGRGAGGAS